MKRKLAAAAAVGVLAATMAMPTAALADWNETSVGRIGFWKHAYGDPSGTGAFGAYRAPQYGGNRCYNLARNIQNPGSIRNRSNDAIWVMKEGAGGYDDGDWTRRVAPGQKVSMTLGTDWVGILSFCAWNPS